MIHRLITVVMVVMVVIYLVAKDCALANDPSASDWIYVHEKHEVRVWRKEIPNSAVIAVRGTRILPFPIEEVYSVLIDNARSTYWMPMVSKKETIRQINPHSRIEYARIRMPWPLKDRYTVAEGSLELRPDKSYWISYKSVEGEYIDPDRIRATLELSTFYLRPEKQNSTYMEVSLLSDPKGSVPKFLVNAFQKNWPADFLEGLHRQLKKVQEERLNPPTIKEDASRSLSH